MKTHLAIYILVFSLATVSAQEPTPTSQSKETATSAPEQKRMPSGSLPKDFLGLADLRATTNADIQNLEKEIKELEEERIPRAESADRRKTDIQQQITETEAKKPQTPEDESKLAELRSQLNFLNNLPSADALSKRLDISKSTLAQKTQQASRIQSALASMLSPEEEFKRTMSITFAISSLLWLLDSLSLRLKTQRFAKKFFLGR